MGRRRVEDLVGEAFWRESAERLPSAEAAEVLRELVAYVVDGWARRLDGVKTMGGEGVIFLSRGRPFLTVNVGRKKLRVYVHPEAGALFEPKATFAVEKFRFWEGSYRKSSGKYKGLSFWISERKHLPGARDIIGHIPKTLEGSA
ncbi:MAG: hypothetical protein GTN49_06535 [candidate division Zixibacteria bacterium]|nr:hypothetical protein [candidate division Zixibacteria bacterium]